MLLLNDRRRLARHDRRQSSKIDRQKGKQQSHRHLHRGESSIGRVISQMHLVMNARLDRRSKLCYQGNEMLSRIVISLAMTTALVTAPMSLSARSCIFSSSAEKACRPGCCANKTCCTTSSKKTEPVSQPMAKSASGFELSAICAPISNVAAPATPSLDRHLSPWRTLSCAIASPRLAVLCTFLI